MAEPQQQLGQNGAIPEAGADLENPFIHEERETGNNESPGPDDPANPPTYTEAVRPINQRGSGVRSLTASSETTPLLNRRSNFSTMYLSRESDSNHVRQQRGLVRALLLWLGIGQWYSGLCIFVSFIFFAGGIILVVLSVMTLHALYEIKLTTVAAGVVFLLLSVLWPCAWLWNQWNMTCGCSYTPLVTYTWLLSLAYTITVGALLFGVNEHYDCVHFCKNCTFTQDVRYQCEYVEMSLWTLLVMLLLMVVFVVVACFYCTCHCLSCSREDRRNYTLL